MERAVLSTLFLALLVGATQLPGFGWTLNPVVKGIYQVGPIKLVKEEGSPVYLWTYQALPSSSGACAFGWWRGLV